jgi:hypothetical protein
MVAAAQFDGEYFVFKNVAVTDLMFKHVDEGYFWDGQVKCELLNPGDLSRYKIGDRLDIVGQNEGIVVGEAALLMKDCIILPAGIVQLPAPGGGGLVPTGY